MKNTVSFASFLLLISLSTKGCKEDKTEQKPNFIFIFSDDLAYDAIGISGNRQVSTPNIDKIACHGAYFTHCYNMGAWHGAVCVASRTMLVTGMFMWNAFGIEASLDSLAGQEMLWPALLEKEGYETYFSGKWHVNVEPGKVFKHIKHVRDGMPDDTITGYNRPEIGKTDSWTPYDTKLGGYWEGGKHWSEVLADDAVEFINHAKEENKPFFMYLAFNAPHDPRQSPKEYLDKYPIDSIHLPSAFSSEYLFRDYIGCSQNLRDERLAPLPRTEYAVKKHLQEYYALITHMDDQIGRILEAIDESGKAKNTYVIFTSDNGLALGNHGFMGKQNMYDHSMRIPLIIEGPGISPNRKIHRNIYMQDIMPTTLDLADISIPEYVDFNSLVSLLSGAENILYPAIYGSYMDLQRMIRDEQYKLIVYPHIKKIRLFNIQEDPYEIHDLAEDPEQKEIVKSLFKQLLELCNQMNDTLDLENYRK